MSPTSMRQVLAEPVEQLEALSQALLRSLGPSTATYRVPHPPPVEAFLEVDYSLAAALHQARTHQIKQKEIERLTEEIIELDAQLRESVMTVSEGLDELGKIVSEGDETLAQIERAVQGAVPYKAILSHASNLANYTSAPPTMDPLRPETLYNGTIMPPFPAVETMRKGKLNFEPPLGTLGETHEVGRRLSPSAAKAHLDVSQPSLIHGGPTQYSTYAAVQQQVSSSTNPDNFFDLDLNPDF